MIVTATEFKINIGKYLALADVQDIIITKNGKTVARLTNARDLRLSALRSLRGIIKDDKTAPESIRAERLGKYSEGAD